MINYNIIKYLSVSFILQISLQQNKLEIKIDSFIHQFQNFSINPF